MNSDTTSVPSYEPVHPQGSGAQYRAMPTVSEDYYRMWRSPIFGVGKAIAAAFAFLIAFLVVSTILPAGAMIIDYLTGRSRVDVANSQDLSSVFAKITPNVFTANNLSLAALILIALAISAVIIKQKGGYMSSVEGAFRWKWFASCLTISAPILVIYFIVYQFILPMIFSSGDATRLSSNSDTIFLLIVIILTTPLQAAGEEYGFRGVLTRVISSLTNKPLHALIAGSIVSAILFTCAHMAQDPWLNLFYFCFGLIACWLTWRTGGLEASISIHIVNNVCALILIPWIGLDAVFNRSSGVAGPWVLINIAVVALCAYLLERRARKLNIARHYLPTANNEESTLSL